MLQNKKKFVFVCFTVVVGLVILSTLTNYGLQKQSEEERLNNIYMPLVSNILEGFVKNKNEAMKASSEQMFLTFSSNNLAEIDILGELREALSHSPYDYIYYISITNSPARYYCYRDVCNKEMLDFENPFDSWFNAFVDKGKAHSIAIATTPHKDKKVLFNNFLFKEGQQSTFAAFGTGVYLKSRLIGDFLSKENLPVDINIMNESGELIFDVGVGGSETEKMAKEHIIHRWEMHEGTTARTVLTEETDYLIASKYLFDISTTGITRQHWYLIVTMDSHKLFANASDVFMMNAAIGVICLSIFLLIIGRQFKHYDQGLQREALIDKLTGKPNRKMLTMAFEQIIENISKKQDTYAFVIFDLDKFKPINDTYGHVVGDKVLVEFANRISNALRDSDVFGRLGGDEFVCLLKISSENAEKIMGRIHQAVETVPFEINDELSLPIHFSYGLDSIHIEDSFDDVYTRADSNLYNHKKSR